MKKVFLTAETEMLIDITLLVASIVLAIAITVFNKHRKTSALFSFFLLFPPLLVFLNMWAHTVAVLALNYLRYQAGTFHFTYLFYSLLLFGLVFIVVSGVSIHCSRLRIAGHIKQHKNILRLNGALILLFLPVGFINPIGFLPVLSSIISSITLWAGRPSRIQEVKSIGIQRTMPAMAEA